MKVFYVFIICFFMIGCATTSRNASNDAVGNYISQYKQQMINGELLRSVYYTGLYDAFSQSNFTDKGINMKLLASFIDISKKAESKQITEDEFNTAKMKYIAEFEIEKANYLNTTPQPQPFVYVPPKWPERNKIRCTTNSIGNTVYTDCN